MRTGSRAGRRCEVPPPAGRAFLVGGERGACSDHTGGGPGQQGRGRVRTRRPLALDFARRGGHGPLGGRPRIDAAGAASKAPRSRRGTMPDSLKDKRGKHLSQLEQDAQALHEKTARLRELRLAHEAANPHRQAGAAVPAGRRKEACQVGRRSRSPASPPRTGVRLPTGSRPRKTRAAAAEVVTPDWTIG